MVFSFHCFACHGLGRIGKTELLADWNFHLTMSPRSTKSFQPGAVCPNWKNSNNGKHWNFPVASQHLWLNIYMMHRHILCARVQSKRTSAHEKVVGVWLSHVCCWSVVWRIIFTFTPLMTALDVVLPRGFNDNLWQSTIEVVDNLLQFAPLCLTVWRRRHLLIYSCAICNKNLCGKMQHWVFQPMHGISQQLISYKRSNQNIFSTAKTLFSCVSCAR